MRRRRCPTTGICLHVPVNQSPFMPTRSPGSPLVPAEILKCLRSTAPSRSPRLGSEPSPACTSSVTSTLGSGGSWDFKRDICSPSLLLVLHLGGCSGPQGLNNDENNDSDASLFSSWCGMLAGERPMVGAIAYQGGCLLCTWLTWVPSPGSHRYLAACQV